MITLSCDKCGRKMARTNAELPEGWEYRYCKELCGECAKNFQEFWVKLDQERDDKIKQYFEEGKCQ